ncbi:AI-2E family transporter [Actinocorallia longicatena]|uniref:AI-2E family transporter n=1 Tax=Actinocorallia longicatena TaxID=111803 RepID=A0ABP6Q880_9ACTN
MIDEGGLRRSTLRAGHRLLVVVLAAIAVWLLYETRTVAIPVVLAVFVASVLIPPRRWLMGRGLNRALATTVVCLAGLLLAAGLFLLLARPTAGSMDELSGSVDQIRDKARDAAATFGLDDRHVADLIAQGRSWLTKQSGKIASGTISGIRTTGEILVGTVLALVLAIYLTHGGRSLLHWLAELFPAGGRERLVSGVQLSFDVISRYIRGIAVVGFVDGFFIGLALWILQVPLALPLAVLTWVGAFLPIVGAFLAGMLAAIVAFVAKGWLVALIVVIVTIAVQQLEGHILAPQIYGRALELPGAVILVVIAFGGTVAGITGAFLAAPVASVAVALIHRFRAADGAPPEGSGPPVAQGEALAAGDDLGDR